MAGSVDAGQSLEATDTLFLSPRGEALRRSLRRARGEATGWRGGLPQNVSIIGSILFRGRLSLSSILSPRGEEATPLPLIFKRLPGVGTISITELRGCLPAPSPQRGEGGTRAAG